MKRNIKHFLLLSTLASCSIYAVNKFIQVTSVTKNLLYQRKGHFFNWKYGDIFYTKQGEGSPIILIHDLTPASSSSEWSYVAKYLEQNHTVYTLDLLGCGQSEKPYLTYTNYIFVQLLTEFIRTVVKEKSDVIVTGDSSSFVLMAAHMDHTIINKIMLINPGSLHHFSENPSKEKNILKYLMEFPLIGTFLYHMAVSEKKLESLFTEEYFFKHTASINKIKDIYYESAHFHNSNGRYLAASILSNYTNINIIPALKQLENHIFIIGSKEYANSIETIESYTALDENIETSYISNCRKLPQLEEPEKLYQIIKMFYRVGGK